METEQKVATMNETIVESFSEGEDTLANMYLTFHLGGEDYGIEIRYVTEIVGMQKITEVPDMPDFVKGVVNLRGQVIPVVDVRIRFSMEAKAYDERTCIVVVKLGETQIGLVVDTVNEVRTIAEDNISPPPKVADNDSAHYIQGMGKVDDEVVILLDGPCLIGAAELEAIEQ